MATGGAHSAIRLVPIKDAWRRCRGGLRPSLTGPAPDGVRFPDRAEGTGLRSSEGTLEQDSNSTFAGEPPPFSLIRMEDTRLLLQDALNRPVDLGEIATLRPNLRSAFERDKVPIF